MPSVSNLFKGNTGRAKAAKIGQAGYDNPRENIDPHIKTKVVDSKEYIGETSPHIVVAAYNSEQKASRKAHYACSGTNDHTIINNAITAVSGGGIVELLNGTYYLSGAVLMGDGVTLMGQGNMYTILKATAGYAGNMIEHQPASDSYFVQLHNFQIDGNYSASGAVFFTNNNGGNTKDVRIREVFIQHMNGNGITTDNAWGWKITNSISEFCSGAGIFLLGAQQAVISNTFIAYNGARSSADYGINIGNNCYDMQVIGCTIYQNKREGIVCAGDYNTIAGNSFNANAKTSAASHIWLTNLTANNCVVGNTFTSGSALLDENIQNDGTSNQIGLNSDGMLYLPDLKKIDGTTPAADGDALKFEITTGRIYGG